MLPRRETTPLSAPRPVGEPPSYALRARSRAPEIRHLALAERAQNYLAQGKRAQARKDLERILAEDSTYEGVREQLDELS